MDDIKIDGLKEVMKVFDELDKNMRKEQQKVVKDAAKIVLNDAKANAPTSADGTHGKPPGTLKKDLAMLKEKSKKSAKGKVVYRVGQRPKKKAKAVDKYGKPYGGYVEYGTSKNPAKPFVKPALEKNRETVENKIVDDLVKKFVK